MGYEYAGPILTTQAGFKVNDEIKRRMVVDPNDICGGAVNGEVIAVLSVVDRQGCHKGEALLPSVNWLDVQY